MAIDTLEDLRAVHPPPAAQAGQKVMDYLDANCRQFIAHSTSSVRPALTGRPTSRRAVARRARWHMSWMTGHCCCRTGPETARWTR